VLAPAGVGGQGWREGASWAAWGLALARLASLASASAPPPPPPHLQATRIPPKPCRPIPPQLKAERIYWDQACVLKQLGLLPGGLPVAGPEQAAKALDPGAVASNQMLKGPAPPRR
jgi:hypothetical protein